jgi:hypothetical protein
MIALLLSTAGLLIVSALVKLKAAERVGLGIAILPLLELFAALGLGAMAFLGSLTPRSGLSLVVGGVVLMVVSSVQVGGAVRRRGRQRTLSEGARLRTFVQYLSASSQADAAEPQPPEKASD